MGRKEGEPCGLLAEEEEPGSRRAVAAERGDSRRRLIDRLLAGVRVGRVGTAGGAEGRTTTSRSRTSPFPDRPARTFSSRFTPARGERASS